VRKLLDISIKAKIFIATFFIGCLGGFIGLSGLYSLYLVKQENINNPKVVSIVNNGQLILIISMIIGTILAFIAAYGVSKYFSKNILVLNEHIKDLSKGNLKKTIPLNSFYNDELGESAKLFNNSVNKIRSIIMGFYNASVSIKSASENLSNANNQTIEKIEHINSSLESISSATEEMQANSKNVLENCQSSQENINYGVEEVNNSKEVILENKQSMYTLFEDIDNISNTVSEFEELSQDIANIINTIVDIADQTNLLALNAAIEAARAGEHGRGFAVVADEVRKLAEKTTASTKQIENVILTLESKIHSITEKTSENKTHVEKGIEYADKSVQSMEIITEKVNEIQSQIDMILRAVEEETLALENLSQSTLEINDEASNVVNLSNTLKQAGENLASLSSNLSESINFFEFDSSKFMVWDDSYSTGVDKFDKQHQKLMDLVNNLFRAMQQGQSNAVLAGILNELAEYTDFHFKSEEEAFEKFGYPDTNEHKKIHADLVNKVMDFIKQFQNGNAAVDFNLLSFLQDWLNIHIKVEDKKYGDFLKNKVV
jgi:methyl-accepting chemotaxis protein/hemerythrin